MSDTSSVADNVGNEAFQKALGLGLKAFGAYIGFDGLDALAEPAFGAIANGIFGQSDPDSAISQQLQQISKQITDIRDQLNTMTAQIADVTLDCKTDLVQTFETDITSLYNEYTAAMAQLAQDVSQGTADAQRTQATVTSLGNQVAQNVYTWLSQMHTFIAGQQDQSLLALASSSSLTDSPDFLCHFIKMKALLVSFFITQRRGIQLMAYASADTTVTGFAEAATLIHDIKSNIDAQQTFWTTQITQPVIDLATSVITNPTTVCPISWGLPGFAGTLGTWEYLNEAYWCTKAVQPWTLEPIAGYPIDVTNVNVANMQFLKQTSDQGEIIIDGSDNGCDKNGFGMLLGGWSLRCNAQGQFRFVWTDLNCPGPNGQTGWVLLGSPYSPTDTSTGILGGSNRAYDDPLTWFNVTLLSTGSSAGSV